MTAIQVRKDTNAVWYVAQVPGDRGKDWGWSTKPGDAIALSRYWIRRFRADALRCGWIAYVG